MSVASGRDINLSEGYCKQLNNMAERTTSPAPLPKVNLVRESLSERPPASLPEEDTQPEVDQPETVKKVFFFFEEKGWLIERKDFSLYIFPEDHQ